MCYWSIKKNLILWTSQYLWTHPFHSASCPYNRCIQIHFTFVRKPQLYIENWCISIWQHQKGLSRRGIDKFRQIAATSSGQIITRILHHQVTWPCSLFNVNSRKFPLWSISSHFNAKRCVWLVLSIKTVKSLICWLSKMVSCSEFRWHNPEIFQFLLG